MPWTLSSMSAFPPRSWNRTRPLAGHAGHGSADAAAVAGSVVTSTTKSRPSASTQAAQVTGDAIAQPQVREHCVLPQRGPGECVPPVLQREPVGARVDVRVRPQQFVVVHAHVSSGWAGSGTGSRSTRGPGRRSSTRTCPRHCRRRAPPPACRSTCHRAQPRCRCRRASEQGAVRCAAAGRSAWPCPTC